MTSRDLIKAARVKIQVGWVQGTTAQQRGDVVHYCVLGALIKVTLSLPALSSRRRRRLYRLAQARLARVVRAKSAPASLKRLSNQSAVMRFNDHLFTDQAQVLALMDEAAQGK